MIFGIVIAAAAVVALLARRGKTLDDQPSASTEVGEPAHALVGIVPDWAPGLNPMQYQRFMQLVEAYFVARHGRFDFEDPWVLSESGDERGPWQYGLTNLAQMCAAAPGDEWEQIIAHHFEVVANELEDDAMQAERFGSFEEARPFLYPRLWPQEALDEMGDVHEHMLARIDLPGTVTTLVFDLPRSVRTVVRDEADRWNLSDSELFEIALANLRKLEDMPRVEAMEFGEGIILYAFAGDSFLTASIALVIKDYPEILGEHGALVGVPTRHIAVVYPVQDLGVVPAINQIIPMLARIEREGPGSISPHLYWYFNGAYMLLPYRLTDKSIDFQPPDAFVEVLNNLPER